jgi:biopolymer transport protein ExbD
MSISGPRRGDSEGEGDAALFAEINITPLTDIFLVLLIIFMVTSSVMTQMGVNVNLPQASQQTSQAQPGGVIVTLLPDGAVRVNDHTLRAGQWDEFRTRLQAAFAQAKARLVILEGDRQALLGNAVEVMDHARKAGAEKFAIATQVQK